MCRLWTTRCPGHAQAPTAPLLHTLTLANVYMPIPYAQVQAGGADDLGEHLAPAVPDEEYLRISEHMSVVDEMVSNAGTAVR